MAKHIPYFLENIKDLTPVEEYLLDYIVSNFDEFLRMNITELAAATNVNISSITKFCQKIGLRGYREFRAVCLREHKDLQRLAVFDKKVPFDDTSGLEYIIHNLPLVYEKSIGYTQVTLNTNVILRICESMKDATCLVYGNGLNKNIADMFVYKLDEVGYEAKALDNLHYQQIDMLLHKGKKVFAILLSHSGTNRMILHVAEYLKLRNVPRVLITRRDKQDDIKDPFMDVVTIIPAEHTSELSAINFSMAMLYVLDVIYIFLLSRDISSIQEVADKSGF